MESRTTPLTCKTATALAAAAVLGWAIAIIIACTEWHTAVTGKTVAATAVAAALTGAALFAVVRQSTSGAARVLSAAVANAPRDSYYRGYGDGAEDALGGGIPPDDDDL